MTVRAQTPATQDDAAAWHHFVICAACLLVLLGLLFVPAVAPALLRVEHWAADWRTALLSDRLPSMHPRIAIVVITDETLESYPYILPPDRELMAEIVTAVHKAGAIRVGPDFYFTRPTEEKKDDKLMAALRDAKDHLVLGAFEGRLRQKQLQYQHDFIGQAGAPAGFINLQPDKDYVIRYRTGAAPQARYRESFSALLAGAPDRPDGDAYERIAWLLPPSNGESTFLRMEAAALLKGDAEAKSQLKDRIVLIGGDFFSLDRHWTPLSLRTGMPMSGVEVHAHMIAERLDPSRSYSELKPLHARFFLVVLACLGLVLGLRFRLRRFDFLDWRVVSLAVVGVDIMLFKFLHLILPFTLAAVAWIAGVTAGTQLLPAIAWARTKGSGQ